MIDKVYVVMDEQYTGTGSMLGAYSKIEYAVEAARKSMDSIIHFNGEEVASYESIQGAFRKSSSLPVKLTSEMGRNVHIFEQIVDINYFLKK